MYLENIDKRPTSEDEEPPTHAMVADQCQVRESAADVPTMNDLMAYAVPTDPSLLCVQIKPASIATCTPCDGDTERSAHTGFFESNQSLAECDNLGLSQPFDQRARHAVCFKPCNSHEQRANHSLASECCCTGHLHLFQRCQWSDQQQQQQQQPPNTLEVIGQSEDSDFIPECSKDFDYEPCESSDSEADASMEDSEMSAFTCHLPDPTHPLDCCEYGEVDGVAESSSEDDVDENCNNEEEENLESEERETLSVYFEETEEDLDSDNDSPRDDAVDVSKDCSDFRDDDDEDSGLSQESEPSQDSAALDQCDSEISSEFYAEEDDSSECSSGNTKPFQTLSPDGDLPPEVCCGSSGESEEGLGDDLIEWDSFEDEAVNQSHEEAKETTVGDVVVEDYFGLFDRAEYYEMLFPQKRRYISCFDGGDIDDHLCVEKTEAPETVNEDKSRCSEEQSEIYLSEDEAEGDDDAQNTEAEEDDEEEDFCTFDKRASGAFDELVENMFAPCAEEIHVNAYEESLSDESLEDESQTPSPDHDTEEAEEDDISDEFSEMELYWSLVLTGDADAEPWQPEVEDYYRYQISGIQASVEQALNELLWKTRQDYSEAVGEDAFQSDLSPLSETEPQVSTNKPNTFEIIEVIDLSGSAEEDECIQGASGGTIKPPTDIIHSVCSESGKSEGKESSADDEDDDEQSRDSEEEQSDDDYEPCDCEYCVPPTEQVPTEPMLPPLPSNEEGKICVAIDLDETLVHSSFKPMSNADFIIPVEIDGTVHQVSVLKRPHVDEFLLKMGEMFECVLFTASLSMYADPVSDVLDKSGAFQTRLFRESCVFHRGNYVKDLSRLGRDLNKVIIIDNSPASYALHPENAVPVASWFDDASDTELLDLLPFFERLSRVDDVYDVLREQRTPLS